MMNYKLRTVENTTDCRELTFVSDLRVEFNSNGYRKRRGITFKEKEKLEKMIAEKDYAGIDLFCYNIA